MRAGNSDRSWKIKDTIARHIQSDGVHATAIENVMLIRCSRSPSAVHSVIEPSFCFILAGAKRVTSGAMTHDYEVGEFLSASASLPVHGEITQATTSHPYLCLQLKFDPADIREMAQSIGSEDQSGHNSHPLLEVGTATQDLMAALERLLGLLDHPDRIGQLGPAIQREILYLVLEGPLLKSVGHFASISSDLDRLQAAIQRIRSGYDAPIPAEELIALTNMSQATFYRRFKTATGLSPIQYQKRIRLLEARRHMVRRNTTATQAAFAVGYVSLSQFFRDYAKMFGCSPSKDVKSLVTSTFS